MQQVFAALIDPSIAAKVSAARVWQSFARLDAGFYCGSGAETRQMLGRSGLTTEPLGKLAKVDQATVFGKRFMQGSEERGVPLYAASELLNHVPATDSFLAKRVAAQFASLMAEPGALLLSRSGSVGRPVLVPPWMRGIAVQDDVLKITSTNSDITRYLYTYFLSPIGQPILADAAFGSVIQHIKVDHIRQIPVIVPQGNLLAKIASLIDQAQQSRGRARVLLQEVTRQIHSANDLPQLPSASNVVEPFFITGALVSAPSSETTEYRLDAHFYNPIAQQAVANIKNCQEVKTVADLARVFMGPRFKRNYVQSDRGVPFLSGKNIVQVRPSDLNYLSNLQMAEMPELLVKGGWTLITCSGTIGRTCFVWRNYEEYAASQHILRVIPAESEIDPGYLYAVLSSQYGYEQIFRYRHGSVIDEVTDKQIERVFVPLPSRREQTAIGDKVREAYEKRAEAIALEDEAQAILMKQLNRATGTTGV